MRMVTVDGDTTATTMGDGMMMNMKKKMKKKKKMMMIMPLVKRAHTQFFSTVNTLESEE